jgi:hypothetical protein
MALSTSERTPSGRRKPQGEAVISEEQFRKPTQSEQAILQRLVDTHFPGRNELAPLLNDVSVRLLDENGSLELQSNLGSKAPVIKRIPVEAEAADEDGITIHVLLHVVDGRPTELEIFKEDNSPVRHMPPTSSLQLIVLAPFPTHEQ